MDRLNQGPGLPAGVDFGRPGPLPAVGSGRTEVRPYFRPYLSIFLYRLLRCIPRISAVRFTFHPFSARRCWRKSFSEASWNSAKVLQLLKTSAAAPAGGGPRSRSRSLASMLEPSTRIAARYRIPAARGIH